MNEWMNLIAGGIINEYSNAVSIIHFAYFCHKKCTIDSKTLILSQVNLML